MLQQYVTNFKQEKLNLQEKTRKDWQDLEKYCEENGEYGRHLRIKNLKKQENDFFDKVLEAVRGLLSDASINTPEACIDCAHCVSRTDDTVIACFTTFRHRTIFYKLLLFQSFLFITDKWQTIKIMNLQHKALIFVLIILFLFFNVF